MLILLAVSTAVDPNRAARSISAPALRVGALANLGLWDEAEAPLDSIDDVFTKISALERLWAAATRQGMADRADKYRKDADALRLTLGSDFVRAASFREAAAIATSVDESHALAGIEQAAGYGSVVRGHARHLAPKSPGALRPTVRHPHRASRPAGRSFRRRVRRPLPRVRRRALGRLRAAVPVRGSLDDLVGLDPAWTDEILLVRPVVVVRGQFRPARSAS